MLLTAGGGASSGTGAGSWGLWSRASVTARNWADWCTAASATSWMMAVTCLEAPMMSCMV